MEEAAISKVALQMQLVPLPKPWKDLECMHIDSLRQECGMFTSATEENNGYGCLAPQNTEAPGCCQAFACPIATECDDEDAQWTDTCSEWEWMIVHSRFERQNV